MMIVKYREISSIDFYKTDLVIQFKQFFHIIEGKEILLDE